MRVILNLACLGVLGTGAATVIMSSATPTSADYIIVFLLLACVSQLLTSE